MKGRERRDNSSCYHVWWNAGGTVSTWAAKGMCVWNVIIIFHLLLLIHCFILEWRLATQRIIIFWLYYWFGSKGNDPRVFLLLEIYCLGGRTAASITLTGWWKPPNLPSKAKSSIRLDGLYFIGIRRVDLSQQSWLWKRLWRPSRFFTLPQNPMHTAIGGPSPPLERYNLFQNQDCWLKSTHLIPIK